MAPVSVRKSGRVKPLKRSGLLSDEFEYDETKFEGDQDNVEEAKKFEVDVSGNISDLLNSYSQEKRHEALQDFASFQPLIRSDEHLNEGYKEATVPFLDISMVCPLCSKELSSEEELELHIAEHEKGEDGNLNSQPISCNECGKLLHDLSSYKKHLKTHKADRPFQCGQCDKSFQDSCSLKRHIKIHEDERPFSCDICLKSFRDAGSISRHMLTHTDRPRMFQCLVCDKNFTDKSGLKRHERTHSGVRPYACDVCNKTFLDSCSFKRHRKIHIGIKNHHCPRCNKSFMEKQSLVRHMKTACRFRDSSLVDLENSQEEDSLSINDSHISNMSTSVTADHTDGHGQSFHPDGPESSNASFSSSLPSFSTADVQSGISGTGCHGNDPPSAKSYPSLSSLIKKDPKLYEGITEIVDSIDSYEKMLDLCGDRGQEEIDAALKRESAPMPDNLLCFECGELLVDEINFKSEGKMFHPSMTNAFKCLSCEEEEEEDEYGEPPVLMPHYQVDMEGDVEENDHLEFYEKGSEPGEAMGEPKKSMIDYGYQNDVSGRGHPLDAIENGSKDALSHSVFSNTNGERLDAKLSAEDFFQTANHDNGHHHHHSDSQENSHSPIPVSSAFANESHQADPASSDPPRLEYEADDPTIPSVFPCHLCTKVFASSSFLSRHLDLHKKSPHKCMVCGKTFTSSPALKRHMRTHTGEKPYSCPKCQKPFRDPSNFSKHKKNCTVSISVPSPIDFNSSCSAQSAGSMEDKPEKAGGIDENSCNGQKSMKEFSGGGQFGRCSGKKHSISSTDKVDDCNEKKSDRDKFPVMAVMPCLDDMVDQSPDSKVEDAEEEEGNKEIDYIPCEVCQKLCEGEQHLERHMKYHNNNPDVTCIECGKSFADAFGMKRHMRLHTGVRPFSCQFCGRTYCDNWSLKKHRSKGCLQAEVQQDNSVLHSCPQCSRVFTDKEFLQEHMKIHKGVMKYECDVCKKGFSEAFNLKKHRRLHMAICPGCGQEFQSMKLLTHHQRTECTMAAPEKNEADTSKGFTCEFCGRVYSTKAYLDRHKKIHSEVKSHVCEICNKRFSEAFKLRRHKKVSHSDLKPFTCSDCGKCFSDDAALKRHAVSSSCALSKVLGEPVSSETCVCQVCHKVFQKNYMLVRHMTVHSQDRPFACDVCGRSYKDTSSLKRHQMVHQGVKDFICPICGKGFYYSDSLKRHMSGRCGKKTKGHRRKAGRAKKRSYRKKKAAQNDLLNNNNNVRDSLIPHSSSFKKELHTSPYTASLISDISVSTHFQGKKLAEPGKWQCLSKNHCWLCDGKVSSSSVLASHRSIHQHAKRFPCRQCFLRFHKKIYWKAHISRGHNSASKISSPSPAKPRRKRTHYDTLLNAAYVPPAVTDGDEGTERKRPRRSVPRAQWSWISQI